MQPVEAYLARLQARGCSPHTLRAYRQDLSLAERWLVGVALLEEVTADQLERMVLSWSGLSANTRRRRIASLRGFYRHLVRTKAIAVDPTVCLEAPKLPEKVPRFLKPSEVKALFRVLHLASDPFAGTPVAVREAVAVALLYYTGCRASELLGLTWGDVDLEGLELKVTGKGGRERIVPIPPNLLPYLERWFAVYPAGFHNWQGPSDNAPVMISLRPLGPLGWRGLDLVVKGALARAGLAGRKITCHKFRHTFATRVVKVLPIDQVQKLLGHRKLDTTTIYAHTELGADTRKGLHDAL